MIRVNEIKYNTVYELLIKMTIQPWTSTLHANALSFWEQILNFNRGTADNACVIMSK